MSTQIKKMFCNQKKIKYKKTKKGKLKKLEFQANSLKFGTMGLKAIESGIVNTQQIQAATRAILKKLKKEGKIWVRIFLNLPITLKPKGARMGKGKGEVSHWGARVFGGTVLFEVCGANFNIVFSALKIAGVKLPIKTKITD